MKTFNHVIFACMLLVLVLLLTGCGSRNEGPALPLEDLAGKLCKGVELPPYEVAALDRTNFEYYAFIPYDESLSAVSADALVNITPHSLVLIRAENGNGAELAEKIVGNADPNKWLCVGSETVRVAYTDHFVLLVMSEVSTADALTKNFEALAQELDGMDAELLTADNPRHES